MKDEEHERTVGLLVPRHSRYYNHEVIQGVVNYTSTHQYLRLVDLRYFEKSEIPGLCADKRIEGLIMGLDLPEFNAIKKHLPRGKPFINVHPDELRLTIPTVRVSLAELAETTVDFFRGLGFRHLATFGQSGLSSLKTRSRELDRCAESVEMTHSTLLCAITDGIFSGNEEPVDSGVETWLEALPKPVGILTTGGYSALLLCQYCRRMGFAIPEDVAILSPADDEACLFGEPPISAVGDVGEAAGHEAIRILDATLGGAPHPMGVIDLPVPDIVERRSTGCPSGTSEGVKRALQYIRTHACQGITIDDVVRHARIISRTRLYEEMKRRIGRSPAAEITRHRVQAAKHYLREGGLPVIRIAEECGFNSHTQFGVAFRREVGCTPTAYRKQQASRPSG